MTIALVLAVNDGAVLASDSMVTITSRGEELQNYEHGNKIFNLHRRLPIGAITWGYGGIGYSSVETLTKDFRQLLENGEQQLDLTNYSLQTIAERYHEFLTSKAEEILGKDSAQGVMNRIGFAVVGYAPKSDLPEIWQYKLNKVQLVKDRWLINGDGGESLFRLIYGMGSKVLHTIFEYVGEKWESFVNEISDEIWTYKLLPNPMPIMSVIELARFLCQVAAGISRFLPGTTTVGGPIEIATITKHEGFKWVQRKHFYDLQLNPQLWLMGLQTLVGRLQQ